MKIETIIPTPNTKGLENLNALDKTYFLYEGWFYEYKEGDKLFGSTKFRLALNDMYKLEEVEKYAVKHFKEDRKCMITEVGQYFYPKYE